MIGLPNLVSIDFKTILVNNFLVVVFSCWGYFICLALAFYWRDGELKVAPFLTTLKSFLMLFDVNTWFSSFVNGVVH